MVDPRRLLSEEQFSRLQSAIDNSSLSESAGELDADIALALYDNEKIRDLVIQDIVARMNLEEVECAYIKELLLKK